jgi:acyl-CoA synthetase (AMP-forming)/AMP-acid ligase II
MHRGAGNFADFSKWNAEQRGARIAFRFSNGDEELASLSFSELDLAARAIAAALQQRRMSGKPVLLLLDSPLDFVRAFNGCLYAGAIAVPVNLPTNAQRMEKIRALARDCGARVVICSPGYAAELASQVSDLVCLEPAALLADAAFAALDYREIAISEDALAFLQYTSGSTGMPKGVMVSHASLIANQAMLSGSFGNDEDTVYVSWLPLYHDMGLVGAMLQSTYLGVPCTLMPPLAFVHKPVRWLKLISEARATTSGAPNFAYELCVRRVDVAQMQGLDLSSWRMAFNGAEPVRASTLRAFCEKFAPFGFSERALHPCYGMAEATLFISGGIPTDLPHVREVPAQGLDQGDVREQTTAAAAGESREIVGCGHGWFGQQIEIVDPTSFEPLEPGMIGEIWVSGPNVADGYWGNEQATEQTFRAYTRPGAGPFLRTGDLGFMRSGELYVTGRIKDLIIIAGRNHYPQDIELTVSCAHPALLGRRGAAFALVHDGLEQLAVVQELNARAARDVSEAELVRCVRDAVMREHGLSISRLVFIAPGKVPITTSGKVRRSHCRSLLLANEFRAALPGQASEPAVPEERVA